MSASGHPAAGQLSYSTVVTIMSRLHAREGLARERAGRGFAYTPVDAASLAAGQMTRALDAGADRRAVLTSLVSGLSGRDARVLHGCWGPTAGTPDGPGVAGCGCWSICRC